MKIHFIGIGGIGVSALAGIYRKLGHEVSGSDQTRSQITDRLKKDGAKIFIGQHDKANISRNTDLVVHSLAITSVNPEITQSKKLKIKTLSYPEAVGDLTRQFYSICVCGTHGKSTVTSLLARVLTQTKFDPNVIVGTLLKELSGRNFRVGKSKMLVLEACEYKRAFLNYFPRIILLNTLDPDHLDYYKDFDDYVSAFDQFALRLPKDGYFFANLDDEDVHEVFKKLQQKHFPSYNVFSYSTKYPASTFYLDGKTVFKGGEEIGKLNLKVPGQHNRLNALGAFAVCSALGVEPSMILKSLNGYAGAYRRYEYKGKLGPKTAIIDDYAHHPAEISATLSAAREQFQKGKICVVFQPHQFSRTKLLFDDFAKSFGDANCVIIPNIYESRDSEKDKSSISAESLVSAIKKNHPKGRILFCDGFKETISYLKKNSRSFSAIITMGAGDVWKVADELVSK